jgi:hypothetical protein
MSVLTRILYFFSSTYNKGMGINVITGMALLSQQVE